MYYTIVMIDDNYLHLGCCLSISTWESLEQMDLMTLWAWMFSGYKLTGGMKFNLWTVPVSNDIPIGCSLVTIKLLLQTIALSHTKTFHFFMIRTIDSVIYSTHSMQLTVQNK